MTETITEMILPGTYIEVRAEGLLAGGLISTGNVGILGTAEMGDETLATLTNFEEARARFGDATAWDTEGGDDENVHLVRALRYVFDNGASTVYAQRVFDPDTAEKATLELPKADGSAGLILRAKTPGAWANRLQLRVDPAEENGFVTAEDVQRSNGSLLLSAEAILAPASRGADDPGVVGSVRVDDQGVVKKYLLQQSAATAQSAQVSPADRAVSFATAPSSAADISASYWVPSANLRQVTLRFGNVQEVYTVPSFAYLAQQISDEAAPSKLVKVDPDGPDPAAGLPATTTGFVPFGGGENGDASLDKFREGLDKLVEANVQLLLVVGLPFSSIKSAVLGHLEKTENLGRERIAVLGADSSDVAKAVENVGDVADKRLVLVTPGVRELDSRTGQLLTLPPYYAAAAMTGKLAALSPHVSPTNKTLAGIDALASYYNDGELKALVQGRVLTLQRKRGFRVVRGITSDDGAFQQISIRRIVDYVKEGTRQRCNQYIGLLNNPRVRGNLRTTLDGFLADLKIREFLTDYKLTVEADRQMEIRGEVLVTMDVMPTFSIDYIRVIMNLS
jgi:Phage tail sheath C-terminal domain/Phage tail sheath protein subtilisin-like domain